VSVALSKKLRSASLLFALPLSAAGDDGRIPLPEEIVVMPWGKSVSLDGDEMLVNEHTAAVLSANQSKLGRAEIALDFEHNTYEADPDKRRSGEPRKVAGYGGLTVVPGKGIVYKPLSDAWTPEGADHYTGKHYRDLSPVPILDDNGVVIAVHSVALTRAGQVEGLRAYSAPDIELSIKRLSANSTDESMEKKYRAIACAALGLPETATDEELAAAGEKKKPAPTEVPLSADLDRRLKAIEEGQVQSQREAIVAKATAAGKAIPLSAEAIGKLEPKVLQDIVDGLEAGVVPLAAVTPDNKGGEGQKKIKALSAEEAAVAAKLGISHEKYREHNPE